MHHALLAFLSVWNLFGLLSSEKGEITQLNATFANGGVNVLCRMTGLDRGLLWKSLASGEEVVFTFHLGFYRERRFWFNETLHEVDVNQSLSYNNLTRQFLGRSEGLGRSEVLFGDLDSALQWLSTLKGRITPPDFAGWQKSTIVLQVKVLMEKRRLLFVVPYETVSPVKRVKLYCP
ncbi:MAG: DUF4390 domain-containing protein [Acidobacteria bacterium]|nr:DUF4390 domain-containing protein [Acidobacteriota bacterium]